ncbi:MAG: PIG-L deacetylase family protein [Deltaproteobacteria bacterium]|nr:PIG-L deacetylase family protein [Deltaproteobacteria bacterium]
MKILVVVAHPDDEVLGCGGTMARLAKEGNDIYVAILGEGVTSRYAKREEADAQLLKDLHDRSRQAVKILGAKDLFMSGLPDNRFDTVPLLDVVKIVEDLVARLQPAEIYTHHSGDLNIDHTVVNRAVMTATRPLQGGIVKNIYAFEVPSSTEWAFQRFEPAFRPNIFTDISSTLDLKIRAMACYESEIRPFPHPRSAEALQSIAKRWGSVAGNNAAEAFELIRSLR